MKPEAQRIAIAKACGWKVITAGTNLFTLVRADGSDPYKQGYWVSEKKAWEFGILPDYLNDLNAMHEAEKVLTREQLCAYVNTLAPLGYAIQVAVCATAAQRAEALLRTLGKWEDV